MFVRCLARTYEYERVYSLIPLVQMHSKLGYSPNFVKHFSANKDGHARYAEDTLDEIVALVGVLLLKEDIDTHDEELLTGLVLVYDSMLNARYEFSSKRAVRVIELFFQSSKLK